MGREGEGGDGGPEREGGGGISCMGRHNISFAGHGILPTLHIPPVLSILQNRRSGFKLVSDSILQDRFKLTWMT
jgi:hypothetical protein